MVLLRRYYEVVSLSSPLELFQKLSEGEMADLTVNQRNPRICASDSNSDSKKCIV